MNQRLIRGKEIAKKGGIIENSKGWIVPSQFGNGSKEVHCTEERTAMQTDST